MIFNRINPVKEGILIALFLSVVALLNTSLIYSKSSSYISYQMKNGLESIARLAAASIDGDLHEKFTDPVQEKTEDYAAAVRPLKVFLKTLPDVRYIYTARLIGDKVRFILDASPVGDADEDGVEDHSFIMDVYENPDVEFIKALKTEKVQVSREPYKDKWGSFITGYAPFFDSSKKLSGVVGIDMKAQDFEARINDLRKASIFNLLVQWPICVLIGFLVAFTRHRFLEAGIKQKEVLGQYSILNRLTRDVVWDWDLRKDTVDWNENLEKAFGYVDKITATSSSWWKERIHPDDRDRVVSSIDRFVWEGEESWSEEYRFQRGDGSYAEVFDRGILLKDHNGASIQVMGIMADVTERKKIREELAQLQRMESVSALAGGIAHELNNQLTPLMGYLDLLLLDMDPKSTLKPYILEATQASKRCSGIASRLLTLSKPSSATKGRVDLQSLGRELSKTIPKIVPSSIKTEINFQPDLFTVPCDEAQLQTIIMNMVFNAREAIESEGELRIDAENMEFTQQTVKKGFAPGSYVKISVSDTGSGIPPEILPKIFEPFFTTKPRHQHSGLGLSIAIRIVKEFGGWIDLESAPGKRTRFDACLPAIAPTPSKESAKSRKEFGGGQGQTVLVVDDEQSLRNLMKAMLTRLGYTVILASDGLECLDVYKKNPRGINAILMDMVMPKCSGRQALKQLLELDPSAKVFLMSGYTTESSWKEFLEEGASGFLVKPFTLEQVKEALFSISNPSTNGH